MRWNFTALFYHSISSIVACNLLHDQTTHGTLFTPFGYSRFRATSCTLRMESELHIEVNHSCNTLLNWRFNYTEQSAVKISPCFFCHSTSSIVACNLLHDQTTHGTLFTPFEHSRFRATSCTLHTKPWITHRSWSFVHQDARYAWHRELRIKVYLPITNKVRWNFTALFLSFHT